MYIVLTVHTYTQVHFVSPYASYQRSGCGYMKSLRISMCGFSIAIDGHSQGTM